MAALQYVNEPDYSAILFRRTFRDLSLPGALMDRSKAWLMPTDARWQGQENIWVFPKGAKLAFGYLDAEADKYRYQSAEFQFIGFDELTQFTEDQYRYLFSRLRRLESNSHVPLRMRSASNPGGIGHDWVKQRFMVEGEIYNRAFIPAKLTDNPHIDQVSYIKSLSNLDPITLRQYLDGDWTARHGGAIFKREKFEVVQQAPIDLEDEVRYWDKAATRPKDGSDPDYTAGVKLGVKQGIYYIMDIKRFREPPQIVRNIIKQTAQIDGQKVRVFMEQEPGSAGVESMDDYSKLLVGFIFTSVKTTGSKAERVGPFASYASAGSESAYGNVKLVSGVWNSLFLDEAEAFPVGSHDDMVDAASGAFQQLITQTLDVSFGRARL